MSQLIFLVASDSLLLALKQSVTGADYRVEWMQKPESVLEYLRTRQDHEGAGILLVDLALVEHYGDASCRELIESARRSFLSIILLAELGLENLGQDALALGYDDVLALPLLKPVLESKLRTHLRLQKLLRHVDEQNHAMDHVISELAFVQDAAIVCLAAIARVRDHSTGNHILRTQHYVKALAEHLRHHPRFASELDSDTIELLYKTAALHDIGKVAIPDAILQKPGQLDADEFAVMKRHTLYGYQAMHTAEQLLEHNAGVQAARFLRIGQQVTLSHHERWDGTGYPQGLKGEAIPVVARLMAVADTYDAICSRRPYKDALTHQQAVSKIGAGRGSQFDPDVVDAFLDLKDTFAHIAAVLEDRFPALSDLTLHSIEPQLPGIKGIQG